MGARAGVRLDLWGKRGGPPQQKRESAMKFPSWGPRRPKHAPLSPDEIEEEDGSFSSHASPHVRGGGRMRDEPDGAGSEDLVVAGPQVAAHMSEQQAIISELRACGKQSLPKAELLSTPNFQALIVRLGTAQHELRELLKEGSLRPDDAKLLLRQSQLMLQLLSELTEGVDADSQSSGSPPPRYTVDNPQQPPPQRTVNNPLPPPPPRPPLPPPHAVLSVGGGSQQPSLIDFGDF